MVFAIDYDGTITSNISFYQQLCHMLNKSGHVIIILSGCKPQRADEVKYDLEQMGIKYHILITRPVDIKTGPEQIGKWKKEVLKENNVNIWFDNEVKNYEDAGVDFNDFDINIIRA